MRHKYYFVRVANMATGEVCELTRWDVSPTKALSQMMKKLKSGYTAEEWDQAIFRCEVNQIVEADLKRLEG